MSSRGFQPWGRDLILGSPVTQMIYVQQSIKIITDKIFF